MPESISAPPALTSRDAVAIIGAGMAGLACAHLLAQHGVTVSLFDKARGPGGRMSSKGRTAATLDLGAQAFTVRDADFAQQLTQWQHAGCVASWPTCTYQASASGWQTHDDGQLRYTGAPRMSALTRYLIDAIALHTHTALLSEPRIVALEAGGGWRMAFERRCRKPSWGLQPRRHHRWRYAQPAKPNGQGYLYSQQGIALCGDSWKGSRVEAAWLSGNGLGRALIGRSV